MDQFEDVLWKFMFPIFFAVPLALMYKMLTIAASEIQQVRKYQMLINLDFLVIQKPLKAKCGF